jgi:precorrin-6A synthase
MTSEPAANPSARTARHRTTLNRIGSAIEITTGRRIAEGFPNNVDSIIVMLDAENAYKRFADQDIDIFWGAYIGTPDEILISGKLQGGGRRHRAGESRSPKGQRLDHGHLSDAQARRRPSVTKPAAVFSRMSEQSA